MMEGMNVGNLTALADLLKPPEVDSDSEDDEPKNNTSNLGPGDIGPKKKTVDIRQPDTKTEESKDIWEEEEVPAGSQYEDIHDSRPTPEYDIMYSQAVTSEDMFLQMGNKTPATASCENMIVKIQLAGEDISNVKLDVKPQYLDCRSPKWRLGLHLPYPVDSKNGKAEWNKKTETLNVTLRVKRQYDFMNF